MSRWLLLLFILGKGAALAVWLSSWSAGLGWAFFFGTDFVLLYHVLVPNAQGVVRVYTRFETVRREVWLTIDDGPDAEDTPRILEVLARHGARATFFLVGERAARHPECVQAILRQGHQVGHHTQTHPERSFWCALPRRVGSELDHALAAFSAIGARPQWFRAPVGMKNLFLARALRKRDMSCVGWTIRSWDSTARSPQEVVDTVLSRVRAGSIVLLHEGPRLRPAVRVQAIAEVVRHLTGQGFRCVLPSAEQLR